MFVFPGWNDLLQLNIYVCYIRVSIANHSRYVELVIVYWSANVYIFYWNNWYSHMTLYVAIYGTTNVSQWIQEQRNRSSWSSFGRTTPPRRCRNKFQLNKNQMFVWLRIGLEHESWNILKVWRSSTLRAVKPSSKTS